MTGTALLSASRRPIQIYTLGRFEISVDGHPLQVSGKTPKKPLDLLRALIAMGGRSVDLQALLLQVWPKEGASARSSFDVALMRLRKLLRHPDVLLLDQGKLTLNEAKIWVDVWSFENAVARCDASLSSGWEGEPLELYRGAFLHEHHMQCVVNMRDRLSSKFQRAVLVVGEQHERAERWDHAAQVYRRALEQDNLAEELYQRLMHCDWKRGHHLEAVKTYRRCCQVLSINLQTRPSAATEALYRRVIAN
jgi:two-component SAPR family response regulator